MSRICLIIILAWGFVCGWGLVFAEDFFIIPVQRSSFAPVEKTGQLTSRAAGDDGDLQKGMPWPTPRFTDNSDGTVTDNLTGLIWLRNVSCAGLRTWSGALTFANSLYDGWTGDPGGGDCGLSDGSQPGQWRLSNVKELQSLIDFGNYLPAFPLGHPFAGLQAAYYWSSTSVRVFPSTHAFYVSLVEGGVYYDDKSISYYLWPVRGGR